ncbi:hypothetical protein FB451DRAFT_1212705 [Mycena latifolia]|nr:hypothetical protein FB451DRAFT_1212705 [Mycena latifolia]
MYVPNAIHAGKNMHRGDGHSHHEKRELPISVDIRLHTPHPAQSTVKSHKACGTSPGLFLVLFFLQSPLGLWGLQWFLWVCKGLVALSSCTVGIPIIALMPLDRRRQMMTASVHWQPRGPLADASECWADASGACSVAAPSIEILMRRNWCRMKTRRARVPTWRSCCTCTGGYSDRRCW